LVELWGVCFAMAAFLLVMFELA